MAAITVASLHHGLAWLTVAACAAACLPAGLRWLRVAQREHYLAGSGLRFAARWWTVTPVNAAALVVAVGAGVASLWWPVAGVGTAVIVAAGPVGLSLKGRTSPLAWTRRLRTLALVWAVLEVVVVGIGVLVGLASALAVVAALAVPLLVDLACAVTTPIEGRLARRFVEEATTRLARVGPTVVGVTGSYGKTSTKNHIAHLVRGSRSVVATPASFNNRAGLARAVNEQLADGTEVFVAEMGTYGPGEIADLCRWCPPAVAVITAIGPVHLERFGSEDRIVEAKAEITVSATDVVLQIDDLRLAALADRLEAAGKHVVRCSSSDRSADVWVGEAEGESGVSVIIAGKPMAAGLTLPTGVQPSNLACALAVAVAVGVEAETAVARLSDLPSVDHRLQAVTSAGGFDVLDDTYNANPAGARAALAALGALGARPRGGRQVVVTPGMVELGGRQAAENRRFGLEITEMGADLVIVGRTNRRALMAGASSAVVEGGRGPAVTPVVDRPAAVAWVRSHLGPGDAVLYENDLPDHYP
jgi:UDP-N-acetylmuramoyl-tripeptide--D-alanyl-D-alanine ligase